MAFDHERGVLNLLKFQFLRKYGTFQKNFANDETLKVKIEKLKKIFFEAMW